MRNKLTMSCTRIKKLYLGEAWRFIRQLAISVSKDMAATTEFAATKNLRLGEKKNTEGNRKEEKEGIFVWKMKECEVTLKRVSSRSGLRNGERR